MYSIRKTAVTVSTNDDAKAAAEAGEAEGLVVWALKQTGGKGRHGRVWESPEGNLYTSILLRPNCDVRHAGHYGFAAALAVKDAVQELLPKAAITLKWPNDVLLDGKKLSGILLEAGPIENGKLAWLVIGIGINVENYPENVLYPATSLRALGAVAMLEEVLDLLLAAFARWKTVLEKDGFALIRAAWLSAAQKGRLSVRLPDGTMEGEFAGLDDNGGLVLQLADGSKKAIATGDVFFN